MEPATSRPDLPPNDGWTIDRRGLFQLGWAAVLLTACGTSRSATTKITGRSESPSASREPAESTSHVRLGASPVPANDAMTVADAQRIAGVANGSWRGAWTDDAGRSGTSDVTIAIDPATRIATTTIAFTGDLLGSPVATETYEIDLLGFVYQASSWQVTSPQFGDLTITPGGSRSAAATAINVGGHADIQSIQISGSRVGSQVNVSYTIHPASGSPVNGTMAWSTGGDRATPPPITKKGGPPNPNDIQTGAYAASLTSGKELTAVAGTPMPDPQPNGGRLEYATGIDVSNGQSMTSHLDIEYAIFVGHTAALTSDFWTGVLQQLPHAPSVAGPWAAALWYDTGDTLYVHATPTRTLSVRLVYLDTAASPGATDRAAAQQTAVAIATKLTAALASTG